MKRHSDIYDQVCIMDNLRLADERARKGKTRQRSIMEFDLRREENLLEIQESLVQKNYEVSEYYRFTIYEPKERVIFRLPYKDRVVQHAIMNILEPIFTAMYTRDTYSCIKGRGIHKAGEAIKKALQDVEGTRYCLKLDICKFYPSVDHDTLKEMLRRKFKDKDLLWLLDTIIDSADGLPIGNYLSQHLSNFFLTGFDHWIKETMKVRYYFRYADDMVIFGSSKEELHALLAQIREYLWYGLKLWLNDNYQVFPVDKRGVDVLGYKYYHTYTLMRKRNKRKLCKAILSGADPQSIASHMGWAKHCNSQNLVNTVNEQLQGLQYPLRA